MKDMEQIEEMLNYYIDGELDERKSNEVKRLIDNDKEIYGLYDSLKRHKNIMDAVPHEPAPQGLCDNITAQLEREILLADTGIYSHSAGRRHLMIRRLMTAAAVLALAAVLSTVVFDIFVPKSSRDQILSNTFRKKPIKQVLYEKPFAEPPVEDKKIVAVKPIDIPFVAILTLKTNNPIEVDWLVAKALTTTNLFSRTTAIDRQAKNVRYAINCDNQSLANLVQELSFVWPQCTETKIDIGTEQMGKYITVSNISAEQAMEICKAEDFGQRMRIAADLGIINKFTSPDMLDRLYAAKSIDYDSLISQKPIITSTEKIQSASLPADDNTKNATLTIIVMSE
ncbi:MAG: hypothetical protein ABSE89_00805 [Sedimentisphaerales bacterium]